ncbi:hypothetical protein CCR94_00010 [Rhodoblastus sphagnicola]|uniref:Nitroreductase domain-containing protein n=1 Tax=Rhodoblastus sphagnicola TaxID=333368 RepID=A0A2S6NHT7_9HYPH|nr:hypothetical protein CCR94_00010 [Rhodoblastus sphagnicola]
MDALENIKNRISANFFDPSHKLTNEEIVELVKYAQEAPSSFNMQNWRVIVFASAEEKEKLKKLAFGQDKVADAAAAFLFVGNKEGYKKLPTMMQPAVSAGALKAEDLAKLLAGANASYEGNDQRQRDEAIRSCSLAAMTLMLASQAKGYASGPMIGFDPKGVEQLAGLEPNEVPAILVVVGRAAAGNRPRKPRLPVQVQLAIR